MADPSLPDCVEQAKQLQKEYRALGRRIKKFNEQVGKLDPTADPQGAKALEKRIRDMREVDGMRMADFSAVTADPWTYIGEVLAEAKRLSDTVSRDDDDYERVMLAVDEMVEKLGFYRFQDEAVFDPVMVEHWNDLMLIRERGPGGARGQRYCAELQSEFIDVFEKFNLEAPYPHLDVL